MFSLIICLVFITFKAADIRANVNPEPWFKLNKTHEQQQMNLTVVKDEPLNLFLYNFDPVSVRCLNFYTDTRNTEFDVKLSKSEYNNKLFVINVPEVTDEMSTRWKCTIRRKHGKKDKEIFLSVHVKGAKSVNLNLNGLDLRIARTNLSVTEYDGDAQYSYVDGEVIDLYCAKLHEIGTLRLRYFDAKGHLKFSTAKISTTLNFRSLLKSKNNNVYIDCTYTSSSPEEKYNYRTTFILKKQDLDEKAEKQNLIVHVNGMKLIPKPSKSSDTKKNETNYIYNYIIGDQLNITCEKRKPTNGTLKFFFFQHKYIIADEESPKKISVALNTPKYLKYVNKYDNKLICRDKEMHIDANIRFLSDLNYTELRILGLPSKNVMYQYTQNVNQWTIVYQYTVNEILGLTCVSNDVVLTDDLQWKFRNYVTQPNQYFSNTYLINNITYNFNLEAQDNGSSIQCMKKTKGKVDKWDKLVEVILHLKSESSDIDENGGPDDDHKALLVIMGCSLGVMIVVITAVCVVCWWARTKNVKRIEKTYENLSNADDSPIPAFPSQWENHYEDLDYAQIGENVLPNNPMYYGDTEKLYAEPYSNMPYESHYTEIDDNFKLKNDGLNTTSNARSVNDKVDGILKRQISQISNIVGQGNRNNSIVDLRQASIAPYDRLRRSNLRANNHKQDCSSRYSNVSQKSGKNKSVHFIQNNLKPNDNSRPVYGNNSVGNVSQDSSSSITSHNKIKQNSNNIYSNVNTDKEHAEAFEDVRVQAKKDNHNNFFVSNGKNGGDSEYNDLSEVNCENEFYG